MYRISLLFLLCVAAPLYAQTGLSHFITRPSFETGVIFQRWAATEGNERLQEIVVPLVFHYTLSERFSASVINTPTRAQFSNAANSSKLTAFTDTRISTALVLGEERGLLNVGVNVPSGPTEFNNTELIVAQKITTHALAMPTNYFGGGLEVSASLALAAEVGKWVLGGAVSGIYKGSYTPFTGSAKYRPGPEIGVSIGFDRTIGEHGRIFGDVGYTWYGKDQAAGRDTLQADGKINFNLAGVWSAEPWQASFLLLNRFKRNSPFGAPNSGLSVNYGNQFEFSGELARQVSRKDALLAVTGVRIHGRNKDGLGNATVANLGAGWRSMLLPQLQLETIARFSAGKINNSQVWGVEGNLGFIFQF
jgi:hypothetical protein